MTGFPGPGKGSRCTHADDTSSYIGQLVFGDFEPEKVRKNKLLAKTVLEEQDLSETAASNPSLDGVEAKVGLLFPWGPREMPETASEELDPKSLQSGKSPDKARNVGATVIVNASARPPRLAGLPTVGTCNYRYAGI